MQADKFFENKKELISYKAPVVIGWELQTPENIGAIIRLCGNFRVEKVLFVNE